MGSRSIPPSSRRIPPRLCSSLRWTADLRSVAHPEEPQTFLWLTQVTFRDLRGHSGRFARKVYGSNQTISMAQKPESMAHFEKSMAQNPESVAHPDDPPPSINTTHLHLRKPHPPIPSITHELNTCAHRYVPNARGTAMPPHTNPPMASQSARSAAQGRAQ